MGLPANATLTFPITVPSNGAVMTDGDGNPIAAAKSFTVIATMKLDNAAKYGGGPAGMRQIEGLQPGQVRMVGRAIKPKFLPPLQRHCRMAITDPVTKQQITGSLTLDLPAQSKFKGVTKALGSKISGVFIEDAGQS